MPTTWLTITAEASLALGLACALIILIAILAGHSQKMAIMNVTWPITALYLGVFALWAYYAFGRAKKQEGDAPEKPFWQSVYVGVTHCGGGCTMVSSPMVSAYRLSWSSNMNTD